MKKLLLAGCLLFLTACRQATPASAPSLFSTATHPALQTPVTVPASPEPSPTPEPSSTPLPRFFTNGFDSSLAGWVILQAGNDSIPDIETEDGWLLLQMDSPYTWLHAIYGAQDYADVRVDVQFENRASGPASIGLMCGYSEEDGWFEFNVSTDGTYSVLHGRWLAVGVTDYLPILSASSREIRPSGASQQIGLTCSESTLSLYINEKLIRKVDVTRQGLSEGKVGFVASSFANTPVVAAFDWVRVAEP